MQSSDVTFHSIACDGNATIQNPSNDPTYESILSLYMNYDALHIVYVRYVYSVMNAVFILKRSHSTAVKQLVWQFQNRHKLGSHCLRSTWLRSIAITPAAYLLDKSFYIFQIALLLWCTCTSFSARAATSLAHFLLLAKLFKNVFDYSVLVNTFWSASCLVRRRIANVAFPTLTSAHN